jgi:hypothetical protein
MKLFYPKMPVDQARKLFLLVMARREGVGSQVARTYLQEKVKMLWGCADADEVYVHLDVTGQRVFDDLAAIEGFNRS